MRKPRLILALALALTLLACAFAIPGASAGQKTVTVQAGDYAVSEDGTYSSMEEVAVYLSVYGKLPQNFITKKQAEALGWNNREGNLDEVAPGCSIGGDYFGNYEKNVPSKKGRSWTECDINFDGGYRNAERIVFSSDGLLYYSDDHYSTFAKIVVKGQPMQNGRTK